MGQGVLCAAIAAKPVSNSNYVSLVGTDSFIDVSPLFGLTSMTTPVLSSTFLLTFLLFVGLFFFIRASVKDRTETGKFISELPDTSLAERIQQYFSQRAYRLVDVDAETNQIAFEGVVRPSVFLAIFLTLLSAVGFLCLALVIAIAAPSSAPWGFGLVLLAPVAGLFYWRGAKRPEKVLLRIDSEAAENGCGQSVITVVAHRDELAEFQRSLPFKVAD